MDLIALYTPIIEATVGVSPEVSVMLFDSAERDENFAFCALVASKPGLDPVLSERCRTHRRSQVRAAWLVAPDRTEAEIVAAVAAEKATGTLRGVAATSCDIRLLTAILDRGSTPLPVMNAFTKNPFLPTVLVRRVVRLHRDRARMVPSRLFDNAAQDPLCHDDLAGAWVSQNYAWQIPHRVEALFESPFVSPETLNAVVDLLLSVNPTSDIHKQMMFYALAACRRNPTTTAELAAKVESRMEVLSGEQFTSVARELSASELKTLAALKAGTATDAALDAAFASDVMELRQAALFEASHGKVRDLFASASSPPNSYQLNDAHAALVLRSFATDREFAGELMCAPEAWVLHSMSRHPRAAELRRAAFDYAVSSPQATASIQMSKWSSLIAAAEHVEDVAKLPVQVFSRYAKELPAALQHQVAVWLAERLGSTASVELLGTVVDRFDPATTALGDVVDLTAELDLV